MICLWFILTPVFRSLALLSMEVLMPYVYYKLKLRRETAGATEPLTPPEQEYIFETYDGMLANMKEYAEVAVSYGYRHCSARRHY